MFDDCSFEERSDAASTLNARQAKVVEESQLIGEFWWLFQQGWINWPPLPVGSKRSSQISDENAFGCGTSDISSISVHGTNLAPQVAPNFYRISHEPDRRSESD